MSTKVKILIIVASVLAVALIIYLVIKKMRPKDVVTGVDNSKIEKAAVDSGIPVEIARVISSAPDSTAALESVGVPTSEASSIANGLSVSQPTLIQSGSVSGMSSASNVLTIDDVISSVPKDSNGKNCWEIFDTTTPGGPYSYNPKQYACSDGTTRNGAGRILSAE